MCSSNWRWIAIRGGLCQRGIMSPYGTKHIEVVKAIVNWDALFATKSQQGKKKSEHVHRKCIWLDQAPRPTLLNPTQVSCWTKMAFIPKSSHFKERGKSWLQCKTWQHLQMFNAFVIKEQASLIHSADPQRSLFSNVVSVRPYVQLSDP